MGSLRDAAGALAELDVAVFAVSTDDVATLAEFHEAEALPFALLSDPDGSAATKYDVLNPERWYASRVTFVLDKEGVVRAIDEEVRVDSHGEDLVERIRGLRE